MPYLWVYNLGQVQKPSVNVIAHVFIAFITFGISNQLFSLCQHGIGIHTTIHLDLSRIMPTIVMFLLLDVSRIAFLTLLVLLNVFSFLYGINQVGGSIAGHLDTHQDQEILSASGIHSLSTNVSSVHIVLNANECLYLNVSSLSLTLSYCKTDPHIAPHSNTNGKSLFWNPV